jgi:DNA-binding MarR family transcriptional regulator
MMSGAKGKSDLGQDKFLEIQLGYQLRRASAALLRELAGSLAELDLRITDATILHLIDEQPDISQSALSRMLGMKRANMAPLAAGLIQRGLVELGRTNGRAQGLRATPAGHALAEQARARMSAHDARVLPELSPDERRVLLRRLNGIWK